LWPAAIAISSGIQFPAAWLRRNALSAFLDCRHALAQTPYHFYPAFRDSKLDRDALDVSNDAPQLVGCERNDLRRYF
jgi:hypothetical protein